MKHKVKKTLKKTTTFKKSPKNLKNSITQGIIFIIFRYSEVLVAGEGTYSSTFSKNMWSLLDTLSLKYSSLSDSVWTHPFSKKGISY